MWVNGADSKDYTQVLKSGNVYYLHLIEEYGNCVINNIDLYKLESKMNQ